MIAEEIGKYSNWVDNYPNIRQIGMFKTNRKSFKEDMKFPKNKKEIRSSFDLNTKL